MGFGELTEWSIGKIKLAKHERNEKFGPNPYAAENEFPQFHHSTIPLFNIFLLEPLDDNYN